MCVCTDVRSCQHQKVNLRSLIRTQWPIFVKLGMWVVGGISTTHVVCRHQMCIFNTSLTYLFWLANNKKVKYPEFCMGYIDETWYVGTDGHKYYSCRLSSPNGHIFNFSFAYLFWLANKKLNIQSSVWVTLMKPGMWVVMGTTITHVVCCHQICIFNTSFAYLFWLANNKN